MLIKLEIAKANVRAATRLGAAQRTRPGGVVATRGATLLVRSRPVLQSSRSRDAAKRSTTRAGPCRSGGGARTATPTRSQRVALLCTRRPSAFLFLAASGSLGRMLMARAHWLIASVAVPHRSSVSSAAARGCSSPAVQHSSCDRLFV